MHFWGFILHWYLLTMNIAQGPDKNFNFCLANVGDVYNLETIWRQFGDKISWFQLWDFVNVTNKCNILILSPKSWSWNQLKPSTSQCHQDHNVTNITVSPFWGPLLWSPSCGPSILWTRSESSRLWLIFYFVKVPLVFPICLIECILCKI